MRKWAITCLLLVIGVMAYSQSDKEEESEELEDSYRDQQPEKFLNEITPLVKTRGMGTGFYGGFSAKGSEFNKELVILRNIKLALQPGEKIAYFVSINIPEVIERYNNLTYTTVGIGYHYFQKKKFDFSIEMGVGYGTAQLYDKAPNLVKNEVALQSTGLIVFEPELLFAIRPNPFWDIHLGVGLRQGVATSDLIGVTNDYVSRPYGMLGFNFGVFSFKERKKYRDSHKKMSSFSGGYGLRFATIVFDDIGLQGIDLRYIQNRKYYFGAEYWKSYYGASYDALHTLDINLMGVNGGCIHTFKNSPIYASIGLSAGAIELIKTHSLTDNQRFSSVGYARPQIDFGVHLTEWASIKANMGYRVGIGEFENYDQVALSGFGGGLTLQFGGF